MANALGRSDFVQTALCEAWADESVTLHRRECTEKVCGGKSKIWWLVRHPKINSVVANEDAKKFVRAHYHVCMDMLRRLEGGSIPWLPGERLVYSRRSAAKIRELLGRVEIQQDNIIEPTTEELRNPFPEVQKSFPETKTEKWRREQERLRRPKSNRPTGLGDALDSLTRKR